MTEPQVWTLIGLFASLMLGGMSLQTILLTRTLRASIDGVRGELGGRIDAFDGTLNGRIDALDASLHAEIRRVEHTLSTKIDHLDRDVSTLMRREWGDPTD